MLLLHVCICVWNDTCFTVYMSLNKNGGPVVRLEHPRFESRRNFLFGIPSRGQSCSRNNLKIKRQNVCMIMFAYILTFYDMFKLINVNYNIGTSVLMLLSIIFMYNNGFIICVYPNKNNKISSAVDEIAFYAIMKCT